MKEFLRGNKFKIYLLLTILWSTIIFSFSLQPADVSSEVSTGFGEWLIGTFAPVLQDELDMMSVAQWEFWHHILRKCAHFTEYFILGVLVMFTVSEKRLRIPWMKGIGIGALVASVDESIQLFVDGRSGQITDVLLDSMGVAVGVGLAILVMNAKKGSRP